MNIHGLDTTVKKGSVLHPANLPTVLLRTDLEPEILLPSQLRQERALHDTASRAASSARALSFHLSMSHDTYPTLLSITHQEGTQFFHCGMKIKFINKLPCVGSQGRSAGYGDIHMVLKLILLCLCSVKWGIGALFYLELNCCVLVGEPNTNLQWAVFRCELLVIGMVVIFAVPQEAGILP